MDLPHGRGTNPYNSRSWRSAGMTAAGALLCVRFHTGLAPDVRSPDTRAGGDSPHSYFTQRVYAWHACPDHDEFGLGPIILDIDNNPGF